MRTHPKDVFYPYLWIIHKTQIHKTISNLERGDKFHHTDGTQWPAFQLNIGLINGYVASI